MGIINVFAMAVDSKVVGLHKCTEFKMTLAQYSKGVLMQEKVCVRVCVFAVWECV
jgi:hypothetical protein